jgi:hypothetical protein
MKLFGKKKKEYTFVNLHLNARLQPNDRFELEDMFEEILKELKIGEVTGGGTTLAPVEGIESCNIEFNIDKDKVNGFIDFLNQMPIIPKGSKVVIGENDIEIGKAEGLALHLNGIDLPTHIYQNYDVNELLAIIDDSLEGNGERLSHWEGERFTSIYYYGKSYAIMKEIISEVANNHPLCQNCVFEQIA